MIIHYAYNIVLIIVFLKSFILGRKYSFSAQNNLFIYLLVTVLIEVYSLIIDKIDENILVGLQYNLYLIFVTVFFYIFYSKILQKTALKMISKIILFISMILILFFTEFWGLYFDEKLAIIVMLFMISHSILWYCNKILIVDETKIYHDPNFWISSGFLLWSCFAIFRCLPMYYFYYNDREFSTFIKSNFDIINIVLYTMLYISLFKYEYNSRNGITSNY